jgi:hypothetical protein
MMLPPIHNAAHTGVYVVETFMSVFIKVAIRFKKEILISSHFSARARICGVGKFYGD